VSAFRFSLGIGQLGYPHPFQHPLVSAMNLKRCRIIAPLYAAGAAGAPGILNQ
jgi:hypothetical protein